MIKTNDFAKPCTSVYAVVYSKVCRWMTSFKMSHCSRQTNPELIAVKTIRFLCRRWGKIIVNSNRLVVWGQDVGLSRLEGTIVLGRHLISKPTDFLYSLCSLHSHQPSFRLLVSSDENSLYILTRIAAKSYKSCGHISKELYCGYSHALNNWPRLWCQHNNIPAVHVSVSAYFHLLSLSVASNKTLTDASCTSCNIEMSDLV